MLSCSTVVVDGLASASFEPFRRGDSSTFDPSN